MRILVSIIVLILLTSCVRRRPPLSPKDEMATFSLPQGFRAELVASEPEISDAIAISFDPDGRIYVVEMPDYPLNPNALGRIKLLEDRDGDGKYEYATVFADNLHFPESAMPWRKGVLVACAPDLLYFEDADGDGKAEIRKVLMTGFATGNPQLRLNALMYGIDNWIYASHPRPPIPRRYVKEFGNTTTRITFPDRPEIAPLEVRGMDVRFRPDQHQVEAVSGNSQFGQGFDSWGNRFTVWNNDHVRHVVIGNQYIARNPFLAVPTAMESISDHEPQAAVFPITEDPLVIHDSQAGHFTSACGLSIYTGANLPREFNNNSFVCEPVHNLVHRDILERKGATFVAHRAYQQSEFMASKDAWFRPVFTTTGPDGALYVVDYYRFTVEHPEFVPPQLLKQIDFEAHRRTGRIWRILHESSQRVRPPKLSEASPKQLVSELSNPNMWWRVNAQRLLVEKQEPSVVPDLEKLAGWGPRPQTRLHALWTLDGLGALSNESLLHALGDDEAEVRVNAVRLAEARLSDPAVKKKLLDMAADHDPGVQFQVACALSSLPRKESFEPLRKIAEAQTGDRWIQTAILVSAKENPRDWFRVASDLPQKGHEDFMQRAASVVASRKKDLEIAAVLRDISSRFDIDPDGCIAALNGLGAGLRQGGRERTKLPQSQPLLLALVDRAPPPVATAALRVAAALEPSPSTQLSSAVGRAAVTAIDPSASPERREMAAAILGLDPSGKNVDVLAKLLSPAEPDAVQLAAASALNNLHSPEVAKVAIDHWRAATGKTRDVLLAGFFNDQHRLPALLDAIKAGTVPAWALGPARTRQLLQHNDPKIRQQAQALLSDPQSNRQPVYDKYLPALTMQGRADSGRKVWQRVCSECHQLGGEGSDVGPDLRTVTKRYRETLLADILMPNQNIEAGYEEYLVETTDGQQITGILAKETPTTLTLRRKKGEQDTVLRSKVKEMRSLSVSPMPENLDESITIEQMADLIAFIKSLK